ncbi:hypothetical protein [Chondromyces apiculatus]|uniref:Uncharacterized protein n=1 Tax=Chondromyces apiculatus DSM 436 TaxID=1192034 RepID=A0A017T7X4_9BACT|nr:hypothetical protein [Chondromyces apiculatus]EYF05373.1 Hypothetical protein CAP_3290 [Chondromyces apiculatus DSM 436]
MKRTGRRTGEQPAGRPSGRARWGVIALSALALLGLLIGLRAAYHPAPAEPDFAAAPSQGRPRQTSIGRPAQPSAPMRIPGGDDALREIPEGSDVKDPRVLWEMRLERSRHTLDSYLEHTRYPPQARPAREQPEEMKPHHVASVKLPLAREDKKRTEAKVTLAQDRFFVVGDETVAFTITCENSAGPAACSATSALAGLPEDERARTPAGPPDASVVFAPAGGVGMLAATFQPSSQGFGGYHGTVRVTAQLQVGSETGSASFDFQYTPAAPAKFTGRVREVLKDGSLDLFMEMNVDKPGRYVLTGRVDDAKGNSFAYLSFNDILAAGRQEARLVVFGKLVHDESAEAPFKLRDVEGYLLKENTSPDRELMPLLEGTVHVTRRYAMSDFSEAAWESDEKTRHVEEFSKDVNTAEEAIERLGN